MVVTVVIKVVQLHLIISSLLFGILAQKFQSSTANNVVLIYKDTLIKDTNKTKGSGEKRLCYI